MSQIQTVTYQMVKRSKFALLILVCLGICSCSLDKGASGERLVHSQQAFRDAVKTLEPGDSIVLADGVWKDFEIVFTGVGTAEKPISLTAQTKGKVIISGQSNLRLAGEHLLVSGLVFANGYTPTDAVISFRKGKSELANHSRVTEVVIDNFSNPERFETDSWVMMYGKYNRFDHNHLEGKRNKGVTMAVRLNTEDSRENYHRIDHNYFGPRPVLGSNGGETLRIGTSHYSLSDSFTLVESNYFDRCDGEVEIVSVKAGGNLLRGNLFYESRGTLTLRHGNDNVIEENIFLGNGVDHTGGIRVINKRQTIRNNYLQGLTGYRFGGGLVVMNGVPNSPINRYHQVDGAVIENNSLIEVAHIQLAAGSDAERSAVPINSKFSNNLVFNKNGRDAFTLYDDVSGIQFEANLLNAVDNPQISDGFTNQAVELKTAANGLLYPLAAVGAKRDIVVLDKQLVGPAWYPKAVASARFDTGRTIDIKPIAGALEQAVADAQAGDIIRLAPGDYLASKVLQVNVPVTLVGDNQAQIQFERSTLFELGDGGSLKLSGLNVSGQSSPDNVGNSVIRTSPYSMLVNYQVMVENSQFTDLDVNRHFNFLNAAKSTMADSIDIVNSQFMNVSGAILGLNKETDDYGIFNADYVNITGSRFENVQGSLADLYRGGTDESTFGPHFLLADSELKNVGAGSKNKFRSSIYLHGVQVTQIENNDFSDSPAIKIEHTVGEPVTRVAENTFAGTPAPSVAELHSDKDNTAVITDNIFK
jgi:poly(beta-D-mannuronate) lyase